MKPRQLRKLFNKVLVVLLCLSFLAQSSPLLAMSYEARETAAAHSTARAAAKKADQQEASATLAASIVRVKPLANAASETAAAQETAAWPEIRPNFTAKNAPIESNVAQTPSWSVDEAALLSGWNLVSLPKIPPDSDPSAVLSGILGQTEVVFAYDGCQPDPWKVYDPAAPPATNDLTAIDQTKGFWLEANAATTLSFGGTLPPTTTIELCTGWNLIAMPAGQARPVRNALFSIDGKYSRVFGYEPEDSADPWTIYDTTAPDWANDLQMMEPGRGYWVLATENTTLTIFNKSQPLFANLISPQENNPEIISVTFITDVIGTAYSSYLQDWTLSYRANNDSNWTSFATGTTPILSDTLSQFDPTLLINGLYQIRLTATDYDNNFVEAFSNIVVEGGAKVGNFSLTFVDLDIPVAGYPLRVTRTYDSRNKDDGDFGVGWTMGIDNIRLEETTPPGENWLSALGGLSSNPILPLFKYCLQPAQAHVVTITLPDETVLNFRPTISPECQLLIPHTVVNVTYEPLPGTQGTLIPLDQSGQNLLVVGGNPSPPIQIEGEPPLGAFDPVPNQLWNQDSLGVHDPNLYKLILPSGAEFIISQEEGLKSITDPNGNTTAISENSITNSSGKGVYFERDESGYITKITDPLSNTITYEYDTHSDLIQVTNQIGYTTTFTYDNDHFLLDIIDPTNTVLRRNEYDENNRLVRAFDAQNREIIFEHDLDGLLERTINRLGYETILRYDVHGNIISKTNAIGATTLYTYDENGNMLTRTDPMSNTVSYTYDERGNMLTEIDPLGNIITRTYDTANRVLTHIDSYYTISFTYDSRGNLSNFTSASGEGLTFAFNTNGYLTSVTNHLGNSASYEYDQFGYQTRETNLLGHQTTYTYDANGNQLTSTSIRTDGEGITHTVVTQKTYDALGRLVEVIDPEGGYSRTEYNPLGQVQAIDTNGYRIEYEYDISGNLTVVHYPDGTQERAFYDAEGHRIRSINRNNQETLYTYSPTGLVTRIQYSDGSFRLMEYDVNGQVTADIDENGNRTQFEYDSFGRRTAIIDALNNITRWTYDNNGNILSVTDPLSHTVQYQYDDIGRQIKTIYPDNTFESYVYDEFDNLIETINQAGISTQYEYDLMGRPIQVIDALDGETTFTFDELGNKLSQTDANLRTTEWTYDNLGRVIKRTLPLGMFETFTYGTDGNLLNHQDFNGDVITLTYDINNHPQTKSYPDGTTEYYAVDALGLTTVITDQLGVTEYTYDQRNRLTRIDQPNGAFIAYGYDPVGNRITTTLPSGTTTYSYDLLNRLKTVNDLLGITTYTYDDGGNLTNIVYPNDAFTRYTYDTLNRLTNLENFKSDLSLISSYEYTLDPIGNRITVLEDSGRLLNYGYDDLNRLITETVTIPLSTTTSITYTYDPVGNILTQNNNNGILTNYTYDANDRLTQANTTTYSYDDNGNTIQVNAQNGITTYEYDYNNQLIEAVYPTAAAQFIYDHQGNRVTTIQDGIPTHYLVDTNRPFAQVLEERNDANTLLKRYVYGADLIAHQQAGATFFYHYDGLGSTRFLTDNDQNIADSYSYDAYGALQGNAATALTSYLYTGEQFDSSLDMYFLRARYYNPQIGRFLTMDTFSGINSRPLSLNKYLYTEANPINGTDPSGKFTLTEKMVNMGAITLLATISAVTLLNKPASPVPDIDIDKEWAELQKSWRNWDPPPQPEPKIPKPIIGLGILTAALIATHLLTGSSLRSCVADVWVYEGDYNHKEPCGLRGVNVFSSGAETLETTQHIYDVASATGQFALHRYVEGWGRDWMRLAKVRGKPNPCYGNVQGNTNNDCDEYPFNSSWEGGPFVADLRLINSDSNQVNGNYLGQFYDKCRVGEGGLFFVLPQRVTPTWFLCRDGRFYQPFLDN